MQKPVSRFTRKWGAACVLALQFLTRVPLPCHIPFRKTTTRRSVVFFPLAGFVIGLCCVVVALTVGLVLPPVPVAVLVLASWVVMSGGLHLDGWMDTADGVLSQRPREQMLDIMKDSRVGAMGVLAAIILLLLKFALLCEWLGPSANPVHVVVVLLLVPVWSRTGMVAAIARWPLARPREGLANWFAGKSMVALAAGAALFALLLTCCVLVAGLAGFKELVIWAGALVVGTAVFVGLFGGWLNRRLGGMTGDTYGAVNEGVEAWLLLVLLVVVRIW